MSFSYLKKRGRALIRNANQAALKILVDCIRVRCVVVAVTGNRAHFAYQLFIVMLRYELLTCMVHYGQ